MAPAWTLLHLAGIWRLCGSGEGSQRMLYLLSSDPARLPKGLFEPASAIDLAQIWVEQKEQVSDNMEL